MGAPITNKMKKKQKVNFPKITGKPLFYLPTLSIITNGDELAALLLYDIISTAIRSNPFIKFKSPPKAKTNESLNAYKERVYPYEIEKSWYEELYQNEKELDKALTHIAHEKINGQIFQYENMEESQKYPMKEFIWYWIGVNDIPYYQVNLTEAYKVVNWATGKYRDSIGPNWGARP